MVQSQERPVYPGGRLTIGRRPSTLEVSKASSEMIHDAASLRPRSPFKIFVREFHRAYLMRYAMEFRDSYSGKGASHFNVLGV
jgi:hypothetical protein